MAKRRRKRRRKLSLGIGRDFQRATRSPVKGMGINEANSDAWLALMFKIPIALAIVVVQVMWAIALGSIAFMALFVRAVRDRYFASKS